MQEIKFTPQTDIEAYLNNDFHFEIYDVLTNEKSKYWKGWDGTFEPLEFLNLLYLQFEFVKANKTKPLSIVKHFRKLKIKNYKFYFFLWYLHLLRDENNKTDKQLNICFDFIDKELFTLEEKLFPKDEKKDEQPEIEFDFAKVKKHLKTLPDTTEKIKYLTIRKTEYSQQNSGEEFFGATFYTQCEDEIKLLKELTKLEQRTPTKAKPQLGQYSNSQLVLIFYYFFTYGCNIKLRTDIDVSPIAKFLHLVTGEKFTSIQNSDFNKKLLEAPNFKSASKKGKRSEKSLRDDLQVIKPLFEKVQLKGIVTQIDNEIDHCNSEIRSKQK